MSKEFVREGKLDREAAAEALRDFLEGIARAGQFDLSVKVRTADPASGMEEGEAVQNADDNSTEYPYDSRGFSFVKFKVGGKTVNAIRFKEVKKAT